MELGVTLRLPATGRKRYREYFTNFSNAAHTMATNTNDRDSDKETFMFMQGLQGKVYHIYLCTHLIIILYTHMNMQNKKKPDTHL